MAQTYNFNKHKKGDTFLGLDMQILVNGTPITTTDYNVRMQLRRTASKSSPVAFEFNSNGEKDGLIVKNGNGIIHFNSVVIDIPSGKYYHDIEFEHIDTGKIRTWVEGYWIIESEVTQS